VGGRIQLTGKIKVQTPNETQGTQDSDGKMHRLTLLLCSIGLWVDVHPNLLPTTRAHSRAKM
jgi:hypothetical protein